MGLGWEAGAEAWDSEAMPAATELLWAELSSGQREVSHGLQLQPHATRMHGLQLRPLRPHPALLSKKVTAYSCNHPCGDSLLQL